MGFVQNNIQLSDKKVIIHGVDQILILSKYILYKYKYDTLYFATLKNLSNI